MKRTRYTEDQIISTLKEHEARTAVSNLARHHGVYKYTNYRWRSKFGDIEVSEAKKLRELEQENS